MVWQPNILNNCYEFSGGYTPRTTHHYLVTGAGIGIRDDGIAAITAMISRSLFTVLSKICITAKSRLRVDIID